MDVVRAHVLEGDFELQTTGKLGYSRPERCLPSSNFSPPSTSRHPASPAPFPSPAIPPHSVDALNGISSRPHCPTWGRRSVGQVLGDGIDNTYKDGDFWISNGEPHSNLICCAANPQCRVEQLAATVGRNRSLSSCCWHCAAQSTHKYTYFLASVCLCQIIKKACLVHVHSGIHHCRFRKLQHAHDHKSSLLS
jgi:hypothetical protein